MASAAAYLVVRLDDGFGEVFPLQPGSRYTLGRAGTNRIVLKDDLCSREHAEVYQADGAWVIRDMGSLNGTRLNNEAVSVERPLEPRDEVHLGRTLLVYVEDMHQLPDLPRRGKKAGDDIAIRKRLGDTRLLQVAPADGQQTVLQARPGRQLERDLSLLYRLALRMGSAGTSADLVGVVLDGLLDATKAEVGAVLAVRENRELELLAYHHRDPAVQTYHKVSQFLSSEVLSSREAVLAEDVSRNQNLRQRESLTDLRATSVICAPVVFGEKLLGLIHLYCVSGAKSLDADDLEFTVAVAKQLGAALHQLQVQNELTVENRSLRDQLRVESELVGDSRSIQEIESQIGRVADTNATVLIRGESGVGKELVARAIHYSSPRKDGPFVCLNCAALTETLLESELFGHEKGAFTGATEKKIGKFEAADHGTIFLDEIGEMNLGTQAKLLRVLEGHPFERVGGNTPIKVTSAWWRRPTSRWSRRCGRARFAATCSSACRWSKSACRRCASGRPTCPCWPSISCNASSARRAGRSTASRRRRWRRCTTTTGPATSASCATWSSGRSPSAPVPCSTPTTSGCRRWTSAGRRPRRKRRINRCRWTTSKRSTSCGRSTTPTGTRARPRQFSASSGRRWIARSRDTICRSDGA